ncbi:putative outer membrane usher protein ElfC precursor [compost metagenome]
MKCFRVVLVFFSVVGTAQANVESLAKPQANIESLTQTDHTGTLIVNVWLNGVDRNTETILIMTKDGEYVECKTLEELGVNSTKFVKNQTKVGFCLMHGLDVKFQKDDALQAIKIDLPASYFKDTNYENFIITPSKADFGGFLNYDYFYSKDDYSTDLNAYSEIGIFKDYWMLNNSVLYRDSPDEGENQFLRVSSLFELEFPDKYLKLRVGDTTSIYNSLLNSFRYGGISFGTNYTDRPDFVYWNMPALQGSAALPSTVDLYINGVNLYKQSITPGNYSLQTGATIDQAGDAKIVVEDILGNQTVRSFPIYISSQLLRVGLNEYDVSLGKLRYNYDEDDSDYRDFFSKVYFRRGVAASTTLGFDATYSGEVSNLSFLWTQGISKFALLDTAYAVSDYNGDVGYAISASVSRNFGNWSFGLNTRYYTEEFQQLGFDEYDFNTKMSNLAYVSFSNLKYVDGLNISYVDNKNYNTDGFDSIDSQIINIGVQKIITRNLYASLNYFKNFEDGDNSLNVMLSYNWGSRGNIDLEHSTDDGETVLSYSNNSTLQNGFDYSVAVAHMDSDVNFHGFGLYKTNIGDFRASYDEYENNKVVQAQYQGALVWLGNKVSMTKYVDNAFALVHVDGMKDIDVFRSLSVVGQTNKDGYLFVHDIIPYINYDISYNQDQLPLDYSFDNSSQKLSALNQRGYILDFKVAVTKKFKLHLKDANNNNFPVGTLVSFDGNNEESYLIDSDGLVYLYLSKPSKYDLKVMTQEGKSCNTTFNISQSQIDSADTPTIDLVCK